MQSTAPASGVASAAELQKACRKVGVVEHAQIDAILHVIATPVSNAHGEFYMKHIRGIQDPLLWGVLWLAQHCAPRDMHAWYRYSDIDTAGLSTAEAELRKLAQRFVTQIWALVYVLARQGKFDEMRYLFDLQYYNAADDEMHTVFFPLETNSSHHGVVTSMYFKTFGQLDPVCVHSGRADAAGFLFERMATHSPAKPPHVRYQMHQLAVARCARCDDVELLEVMIQLSEAHPTLKALAFPLDCDNNAILRTAVKHNSMRVVRCLLRLDSKHGVDAWAQRGHIIATAVRGGRVDFLHEVLTALGGGVTGRPGGLSTTTPRTLPWHMGLAQTICGGSEAAMEITCVPSALLSDGRGLSQVAAGLPVALKARVRGVHGRAVWHGGVLRLGRRMMVLCRAVARSCNYGANGAATHGAK